MMGREGFLAWVRAGRWRTAKSSPHQYTIKHWHGDREAFFAAVRHAHENGEEGHWNQEQFFYYYRPGDGYRYWSYYRGDDRLEPEGVVAFNRAWEGGGAAAPAVGRSVGITSGPGSRLLPSEYRVPGGEPVHRLNFTPMGTEHRLTYRQAVPPREDVEKPSSRGWWKRVFGG